MKYFAFLIIMIGLGSCKKQELPLYQGGKSLAMEKNWSGEVAYSFARDATLETQEYQLVLPIVMIGGLSEITSPFEYQVQFEAHHFDWIPEIAVSRELTYSFSGSHLTDSIRITILRIPELADTSFNVQLKLVAPRPYDTPIAHAYSVGLYQELAFEIDDIYKEPLTWIYFEDFLGTFSSKKMRIICSEFIDHSYSQNQLDVFFWNIAANGEEDKLGRMFRDYLNEKKAMGSPVLERNGEEMTAGPDVYE